MTNDHAEELTDLHLLSYYLNRRLRRRARPFGWSTHLRHNIQINMDNLGTITGDGAKPLGSDVTAGGVQRPLTKRVSSTLDCSPHANFPSAHAGSEAQWPASGISAHT